jgi:hypothetical protein
MTKPTTHKNSINGAQQQQNRRDTKSTKPTVHNHEETDEAKNQ